MWCLQFLYELGFAGGKQRIYGTGFPADAAIYIYTAKQISNLPIQVTGARAAAIS